MMTGIKWSLTMNIPGTDPHIWLSPVNAGIMADNIYEGLVMIDPDQ